MTIADSGERHLRSDAQRNRTLLLAAAREAFSERGVDVSADEIVERAGVGIGTLYRHFPNREALVDAIFEDRGEEVVAMFGRVLEVDDPAAGLWLLLEQMVEMQRADSTLKALLMRYPPSEGRFVEMRERLERLTDELLERARSQGVLRADYTRADFSLLFWSLGPILEATGEVAPDAWRRHLAFVLDGLRPEAARPATSPPLTDEQLAEAMQCLRAQRFGRRGGAREQQK
ncbi:MAG TPA: helix-turn-helix domain-containing protein [Gaiellaceae bacterium]|jgi:AcrR family transcriptional regulator